MNNFPRPNYDYDVKRLTDALKTALRSIQGSLQTLDMNNYQQAFAVSTIKDISDTLKSLNVDASAIIAEIIPNAAKNGVAQTIYSLELVGTIEEARKIAKFGKLNTNLVKTIVADTQDDLLAVTKNVERRVRNAVRKTTATVMRENVTRGVNGTPTLSRKIREKLIKDLGESANTSIIDAGGRRWKLDTYTDMLVQTKMMEAHKEASVNEALEREAHYGVISRQNATDDCRKWEGKIVKYLEDAPGDYAFLDTLPKREIFHPNCRHTVSAIKDLSRLPDDLKALNEME